MILEKSIQTYPKEREAALAHCIINGIWSANDFRYVAAYLNRNSLGDIAKGIESSSSIVSSGIQIFSRSIGEYVKILGGEINE